MLNFPERRFSFDTSLRPHKSENKVNPPTPQNMTSRQRLSSHPVVGVATAVAMRSRITTPGDRVVGCRQRARISGNTTLARVIVIPNSRLDSSTASRIDQPLSRGDTV
jgi:hypothetical protein